MSDEPSWISASDAIAFQAILIDRYGGTSGIADLALIESAMSRPQQVYHYETRDLFVLAATYGHSIIKNHGFVDGNKRTAFVVTLVFLEINDVPVTIDQAEAVMMVEGLASGRIERESFASWLRKAAGGSA